MLIYQVVNKISGKSYIGQTKFDLKKRIKGHKDKSIKSNTYFPNAIKKYGIKSFEWKTIRYCNSKQELNMWEKYYIKKLQTKYPNGYNLSSGGDGGDHFLGKKHTKEAREKMSLKMMGNKNGRFKKNCIVPKETREKISKKLLGRKLPMETRIKMSQSRKGISTGPKSLEAKLKLCSTYFFMSPNGKKIICKIGFKNFCRKYQLSISSMWRALKDQDRNWRGWTVKYMEV